MTPVLYLSHPYSNDPTQSFQNAVIWTKTLRQKGYTVFSPILHTHSYYDTLWRDWDEPYDEDFVSWDLALLKALMKGDGKIIDICPFCACNHFGILTSKTKYCLSCNEEIITPDKEIQYDSGVVMLLDSSAYIIVPEIHEEDYIIWRSDGCRQEYEFCKANYIQICDLKKFMEGERTDV